MKLFIRESGGGSRTLLAGLATAVILASAAESVRAAQVLNPSSNPVPAPNTDSPRSAQLPWISEVTKMADAGVAPDVMEAYVKSTPSYSLLSVDDILYLKRRGVSDNVVAAMIQHGANGQQAAAAAAASQYAPPPQYYAGAPTQSDYPAADYSQGQSSVYVVPQYYPNYYYPYYYSYGYPFYYWNYGYRWRPYYNRGFYYGRYGRPGFHGGFAGSGFHGGFNGHVNGGVHSAFSPVASIGFHGGGMGMHGGGMSMGMHGGGGGMAMGGHGSHR